MNKKRKSALLITLRILLTAVFGLLTVFLTLPLLAGIDHIGVWVSTAMSGAVTVICAVPDRLMDILNKLYTKRCLKIIINCVFTVAALLIVGAIIISCMMAGAMIKTPQSGTTAIVLGGQVRGTEPSLMLKRRLDAALEYLNSNPDAMCIVSGGQGNHEDISEAQCMFDYLTGRGISPDRVIMEDKSTSTQENLQYSTQIMRDMGMDMQAVIVTDGFHQWRGQHFAKQYGIHTVYAKSCDTPYYLAAGYWIREIFAVARVIAIGY